MSVTPENATVEWGSIADLHRRVAALEGRTPADELAAALEREKIARQRAEFAEDGLRSIAALLKAMNKPYSRVT